jgi:hypothetical protein
MHEQSTCHRGMAFAPSVDQKTKPGNPMSVETLNESFAIDLDAATLDFYRSVILELQNAQIPFLVGGSHALVVHTQMPRRSKDLDLFVLSVHLPRVLQLLSQAGFRTELTYSHWLGKAYCGQQYVDIIFNSGNGLCPVDDRWFEHAIEGVVLGLNVQLCPLEETIWQKAFIMERHRYDGADVVHLLRAGGESLDWRRLLERFGDHWRVLLSHLVLFSYIYPDDEQLIPEGVRRELMGRYLQEAAQPPSRDRLCGGTYLSSLQYQYDLERDGLKDARLQPQGPLSEQEVAEWMTAFETESTNYASSPGSTGAWPLPRTRRT